MDDEAKKIILARRARFIAAALASLGVAQACDEGSGPEACLSFAAGGAESSGGAGGAGGAGVAGVIAIPDAGVSGAGGGSGGEGGDADGGDADGGAPQPCLVPPN